MNKDGLSLIIGLTLSILFIIGFTSVYPIANDLWLENQFWNGLSSFYINEQPTRFASLTELDEMVNPSSTTLFIIGPYQDFSEEDARAVNKYLEMGGLLVLSDDFGSGNQLLSLLDLDVRFDSQVMVDPIFREKNSVLPKVTTTSYPNVEYIVLNYPTVLVNVEEDLVTVWSSPVSYTISNLEEEPDSYSSFPVMAEVPYAQGKIILISDSSVFINSMIEKGDNMNLLKHLAQRTSIIDESHILHTKLTLFQTHLANIYRLVGVYEIRYTLALGFILFFFRLDFRVQEPSRDPVEEVMNLHPEYDRNIVEWLDNERGTTDE
jgi:hypothetical protein